MSLGLFYLRMLADHSLGESILTNGFCRILIGIPQIFSLGIHRYLSLITSQNYFVGLFFLNYHKLQLTSLVNRLFLILLIF